MADWGYSNDNGPEVWPKLFPVAAGVRQSPVDIDTDNAAGDNELESRKLAFSYEGQTDLQLINTGAGWKVQVPQEESRLEGGPLGNDIYRLEQFHCHWGETCDEGSEHTVNGKPYSGELHLVHWNTTKYGSFAEAAQYDDGLAVLGIFLEVGEEEHEEIQKICSQLSDIRTKNSTCNLTADINPMKLLPDSLTYWTYLGSLTTPPCSECVTWIVFKKPIKVTDKQLEQFRSMSCSDCDPEEALLIKNYRPPQPIGNRCLRACNCD